MDTIVIKIYGPGKFNCTKFSSFVPELSKRGYENLSETEKRSTRPYLRKFVLHTKKQEEYTPRVEVFETLAKDRRNVRYILKIEFSAPKLLYWNSLQEIGEKDGERIFNELKSSLANLDVLVGIDAIKGATVTAVHVCKNIPLPRNIKIQELINELSKIDINKAFDISHKQYKNGASVLNIYSGTIDWSFYDKISDSLRPKNKRSDKSHISPERSFIEKYKLQNKEVFRYEYRLKKNQTVKREVNKILHRGGKTPVCFIDLFEKDLLKTILINSWRMIVEKPENQLSFFNTIDKLKLLLHIFSKLKEEKNKAYTENNAFVSYGIVLAIQDFGVKEIKSRISDLCNTDHPERFNKKINTALELTKGLSYSSNITYIDEAIKRYELISLTSLENGI